MIGVALFGAGVIGSIHAGNVADHPKCGLVHVVDVNLEKAEAISRSFGGTAGTSVKEALNDPRVDAVIIASSTVAHAGQVLACAKARKPLLCEKPVSDDLGQARLCIAAVEQSGVVAAMGFNRRLDPEYRSVFERCRAGEIGAVESLYVASRSFAPPRPETVRDSGGMIREKGAHFYDLVSWISGARPVEVFAAGTCLIDPEFADHGDVDTAALTLRLDSGALASFNFGRRTAFGQDEWIEVFGADGMLLSGRTRSGDVSLYKGASVIETGVFQTWQDRFAQSYILELDAFVAALELGAPVHASLADGLRAQAVAEAAICSLTRNAPVRIENVWT